MNSAVSSHQDRSTYITSIVAMGVLYFIIGFVTWLNGPLITFVKLAFDLDDINAFLVPMAFYLSYFFLALPASWILRRTGMKKGMVLGLLVMAVGAFGFGEFANVRVYAGLLTSLFVVGAGLSLLQTAINPYVSILGPIESAAQRISIMGICNKFGGILAPLVLSALVLSGIGEFAEKVTSADAASRAAMLSEFASKVRVPYWIMGSLLVIAAILALRSSLPEIKVGEANASERPTGQTVPGLSSFPHLWLGVLCLFLYVGVEVMAGDAIGTYGQGFKLPLDETKLFTMYTLIAMLVGYVVGWVTIPRYISQERYLAFSAVLGVLFSLAALFTTGYVSVGFVAALGFANAMMWPAIFPLAIRGLGRYTELGSAFLIMGIAGGAVIPQIFAHLKSHYDFQIVFCALMVPAYVYIFYYAVRGYAAGRKA